MSTRLRRAYVATATLLLGAAGLLYEYVLSVLGNTLLGSRLDELLIIMALMMFAMGMGSLLQQRLAGPIVDWFLGLQVALGLFGGVAATAIFALYVASESFLVVLYLCAALIGLLVGMQLPLLLRLHAELVPELRKNLGTILSLDYVGALLGALAFVLVLLTWQSLARIGFVLGLANVAVAVLGLVIFRDRVRHPRAVTFGAAAATLVLGAGVQAADDWSAAIEQRYFRHPIVFRETSQYQHIVLTKRGDRLRLHLNRHLQFDSQDEAIYHELLVHPAMSLAPSRARVLILGGGDGLALREVLAYPDVHEVTLIDIDPVVVRMGAIQPDLVRLNRNAYADPRVRLAPATLRATDPRRYPVVIDSERRLGFLEPAPHPVAEVEIAGLDADTFLGAAEGLFDVAIVDFVDPREVETAKLFSRELYESLRQHLTPTGVVAVQGSSPYYAREVFLCIGETLRAAGFATVPYQHNVPSFNAWGFHLAAQPPLDAEELRQRLRHVTLQVETTFLTAEVVAASTVFGKGWLDSSVPIEVNTKLNPVILRYARYGWRKL
jgi:spermidine synthase